MPEKVAKKQTSQSSHVSHSGDVARILEGGKLHLLPLTIISGVLYSIVLLGVFAWLYYNLRTFQPLVMVGIAAFTMPLWWIARGLGSRAKNQAAGFTAILALVLLLTGQALIVKQDLLIAGILGMGVLLWLTATVFYRRWYVGLLLTLVYAASALVADRFDPLLRLNISQVEPVGRFFPFILPAFAASLVLFLIVDALIYSSATRRTIGSKLMVSFVAVVLISTVLTTIISVTIQTQTNGQTTTERLRSTVMIKSHEIDNWYSSTQAAMDAMSLDQEVQKLAVEILSTTPSEMAFSTYSPKQIQLRDHFQELLNHVPYFTDMFLVNGAGRVLISLEPTSANYTEIRSLWPVYNASVKKPFITPLFSISKENEPLRNVVIAAFPLLDSDGNTIGVIGGRADTNRLQKIMAEEVGMGQTGELYLVNASQVLVSRTNQSDKFGLLGKQIDSDGIRNGVSKKDGVGEYINYRNARVFGAYQYVPSIRVTLIAEQEVSEALMSARLMMVNNIVAAIFVAVIAALASIFVTRSISTPIRSLVDLAGRFADGDLEAKSDLRTNDEIGILGQAFNSMTSQIRGLIGSLEQRVASRTSELEERALQIQVAGDIAHDIALAENLDEVLVRAVNLIHDRFGFYHAGIFLADERREYAVLRAATGEAGKALIGANHRLKIGESGIVGYVVAKGQPRLSGDVGADEVHYKNPILPLTQAELGLPLKVGSQTIGALDVQSTKASAFQKEDIEILQTLADQLAVAIDKARLLEQVNQSLRDMEASFQQRTRESWQEFLQLSRRSYAFRYNKFKIEQPAAQNPELMQALQQNQPVISAIVSNTGQKHKKSSLAVPIQLRGEPVGALNLQFDTDHVNPDIVKMVENVANRLAIALENARLLEENQRRAEREHRVSDISAKVRASTEIDRILRVAVEELGRTLGVSEATIQLTSSQEPGQEAA